ncbi:hypothetical protein RTH46_05600 [Pseudomonas sp. zfem004]|uniref:hypothetical protein n=1 Tax=unclassified Pseudomonas TaxID=196821 RepID=UPI00129AC58A|nr:MULTISPECIES: hypothetical protein [unclassified Pseudomonas]MDU9401966.1 hypothetical protein [Pseudomonas sp. zfem004]
MDERSYMEELGGALLEWMVHDGHVLFSALLAALLVSVTGNRSIPRSSSRLARRKKLLLVFVTVGVGQVFEPLVLSLAPMLSRGMAAFVAAVVVIPISLKVMDWLDTLDLRELVERWRSRR